MNQLRRHKQWYSLCCAVYPGLVCLALRYWNTRLAPGPGQPQSAWLAGWKLLFCRLLHSLTPGRRKSRIPATVSRNRLTLLISATASCHKSHTVCRWPSASGCTACCSKGRALSVAGNDAPFVTTQQHWVQRMLGLGEMSLHLGALATVSVHEEGGWCS